jgi:hypothetical protein
MIRRRSKKCLQVIEYEYIVNNPGGQIESAQPKFVFTANEIMKNTAAIEAHRLISNK